MACSLAAAIVLIAALQAPVIDRSRAEDLARAGRTVEAIQLFARIVETNPADVEAKLWLARLQLRLGRTEDAGANFRSVRHDHPDDVDARFGLGMVLTRTGAYDEALTLLEGAERVAGQNADLFAALAPAYRRAGDDRRAIEYVERAKALAPHDPDVVLGFEARHARKWALDRIFEGFGQQLNAWWGCVGTVQALTGKGGWGPMKRRAF
jgi:tetratricopeptide (TPR) repeat protein